MKKGLILLILISLSTSLFAQSYTFESDKGYVKINCDTAHKPNLAIIHFFCTKDSSTLNFQSKVTIEGNHVVLDSIGAQSVQNNLKTLVIFLCQGELCETVCHAFSYDRLNIERKEPEFMQTEKFWTMHGIIQNGRFKKS